MPDYIISSGPKLPIILRDNLNLKILGKDSQWN